MRAPPQSSKPRRPPLEIWELELQDLPAVYALGERIFRAGEFPSLYRTWDEFELVNFYGGDYDTCFGAHRGDKLIGFILGTVLEKRRSAWSYGWVVWVGVEPEEAREGVASRLLERLTERFIELGCRMLLSDTDPRNAAAMRFFERAGFGSPREHIYLEKNLAKDPAYASLLVERAARRPPRPKTKKKRA